MFAVMNTTYAVGKIRREKKFRPAQGMNESYKKKLLLPVIVGHK